MKYGKENPFSPEEPHDNFLVTIGDARQFFLTAFQQFDNHENVTFPLSPAIGTDLDGNLLDREATLLYLFHKDEQQLQMTVMSSLYLSDIGLERTEFGVFSINDVLNIQDILITKGIISTVTDNDAEVNLMIMDGNLAVQAVFPKTDNKGVPRTIQLFLLELTESIASYDRSFNDIGTYPQVRNAAHFETVMETYALLYTHILNALYRHYGLIISPIEIELCQLDELDAQEGTSTLRKLLSQRATPEVEARRKLSFADIAGQHEAVEAAKEFVDFINNSEEYQQYGDENASGILLVGPAGTGKSLLARIIADEADAKLFEVKVSEVASKWYGEAEKRMQLVFDLANTATQAGGKAIILIEEFDSMFSLRDEAHEVTKRIAQVYLNNTGGENANPNIFIIGSSNRSGAIDEAFKRSGRIDLVIEMGIPKTTQERREILDIHIRHKEAARKNPSLVLFDPLIDWDEIAQVTAGMSGADLENVIKSVCRKKTYEKRMKNLPQREPVTTQDLLGVIKQVVGNRPAEKPKRSLGFDTGTQVSTKLRRPNDPS